MLRNNKNKAKKKDKLGKANRNSTISPSCSEIATECRQQQQQAAAKAATQQLSLKRFHPTSFKNKTVVSGYLKCPGYSTPHPTQSHHLPGATAAVYRQTIGLKPPVGLFFRESGNNNSQPKHGLFSTMLDSDLATHFSRRHEND